MIINLNPSKIYLILLVFIGLLILANLFVLTHTHFGLVERSLERTTDMFLVDREGNLPTLFSFFLIFICSVLVYLIGRSKKRNKKPSQGWFLMSWIFLFLSIDEGVQIHEVFNSAVRSKIATGGIFYYAWIIPYAALVAVFVAVFVPFLKRLPLETRRLFLVSGGIFILGAVGMEMAGGYRIDNHGEDFYYGLISTVEEFLEMFGMATFCYALLRFIESQKMSFSFQSGVNGTAQLDRLVDTYISPTGEIKSLQENSAESR